MASVLPNVSSFLPRLAWTSCLDILLCATLIYQFILLIRGRRAGHIIIGVALLAAAYLVAIVAQLELLRTMLAAIVPYSGFALIVVFQSDIRRMLARLGRRRFRGFEDLQRREIAAEIMLAVRQLSMQKTGALIVVERNIGLRTFIESGVNLDAVISRDLLLAIFFPRSALHDGAVIVQGDRIAAASCFLPLTTNPALTGRLGTRHRAGIGVTEEADCLAVIVSEETGRISLAVGGEIELGVPEGRVSHALTTGSIEGLEQPFKPSSAGPMTDEATLHPS